MISRVTSYIIHLELGLTYGLFVAQKRNLGLKFNYRRNEQQGIGPGTGFIHKQSYRGSCPELKCLHQKQSLPWMTEAVAGDRRKVSPDRRRRNSR